MSRALKLFRRVQYVESSMFLKIQKVFTVQFHLLRKGKPFLGISEINMKITNNTCEKKTVIKQL